MKFSYWLLLFFMLPCFVLAGEWNYNIEGGAQALYGYSDLKKHHNGVGKGYIDTDINYSFNDTTSLSLYFSLMAGINRDLQNYNQGRWGEDVYTVFDSRHGQIMVGQIFNVASLFHNGVGQVGALGSNNDVADFISNPNWLRTAKKTKFATLNSTDINTDGVAPKFNYISPEFYGTAIGFSFVPDSYNRRGLINKHANYSSDKGLVGAIYNDHDWGLFSSQTSVGYAQFHDNDKEFSYSLKLSRGNWSIGGGFRKTYVEGEDRINQNKDLLSDFDGYREGQAWNIGLNYEIGPFSSSLSYFESQSDLYKNSDKIVAFSNQYSFNKNIDIYVAAAHVNFKAEDECKRGYTMITGLGVKF